MSQAKRRLLLKTAWVCGVLLFLMVLASCGTDLPPDVPTCTTNCTGKQCGDDGCGESCGTCIAPKTCGGGGIAGVCQDATPNDTTDKFGITMFYPTKTSGHSWDSQALLAKTFNTDWDDSHVYDPEVSMRGDGQYTGTGNGELKVGKNSAGGESPRFYIGNGSRAWDGNVEVTFYSKVGAIDKTYLDGDPAWPWGGLEAVVRTTHNPDSDACNSRGYGGRMTLDGDCDFEKEQSHPAGANSQYYKWISVREINPEP